MRCKSCGGIVGFLVVDVLGHTYYRCNNGLARMGDTGSPDAGGIFPCGAVQDELGQPFVGRITYRSNSKDVSILNVSHS